MDLLRSPAQNIHELLHYPGMLLFSGICFYPSETLSGRKCYLHFVQDSSLSRLLHSFCYFAWKLWADPGWVSDLSELEGIRTEREEHNLFRNRPVFNHLEMLQDSEGFMKTQVLTVKHLQYSQKIQHTHTQISFKIHQTPQVSTKVWTMCKHSA